MKNNALITNISAPFKKEEEGEALFGVEVPNPFEVLWYFSWWRYSHNVSHHLAMGHKIMMRIDMAKLGQINMKQLEGKWRSQST